MKFIWGLVGVAVGFLVVKYSFQITNMFGRIDWAEQHLSGTYTFYKIVGVIFIILSMLYMFGGINFLVGPLAPLFGGGQ